MRKQLRSIIIALCVVVILIVGVVVANIIIKKQPAETSSSSSSDSAAIPVINIKTEDVTELNVKNAKGEYTIKQSSKTCSIDGIDSSILNQDSCSQTITKIAQLNATKEIEKGATNLSQYGLDKPSRTVVIKTANKEDTLYIGAETPLKDGIYVTLNNDKNVFKVNAGITTNLDNKDIDFIKLNLYSIDSDKSDLVTKIELGGAARKTPLVLEHKAATSKDDQTAGFVLTNPATYSIDAQKSSGILTDLSSLSALGVISLDTSDTELDKYGLKDPQYTVKITNNGKTTEFLLGKSYVEDGEKYIPLMVSGTKVIYKYGDKDGAFYKYELSDLCTTLLFTDFIDTVKTIDINLNGEKHSVALDGTGDDLTGTVDGKKISTANTRKLYQYVVGIAFEGQTDEKPSGDPKATIKVTHRDSSAKDTVMEFVPMGDRKCFWVYNGRSDFYILNADLDKLQEALDDVKAGKDIKDY